MSGLPGDEKEPLEGKRGREATHRNWKNILCWEDWSRKRSPEGQQGAGPASSAPIGCRPWGRRLALSVEDMERAGFRQA